MSSTMRRWMVGSLLSMLAVCACLLAGCEDSGQARAMDADIERGRLQIAALSDEKVRLEAEVQRLDRLTAERAQLVSTIARLRADRDALVAALRQAEPPPPSIWESFESSGAAGAGHPAGARP